MKILNEAVPKLMNVRTGMIELKFQGQPKGQKKILIFYSVSFCVAAVN